MKKIPTLFEREFEKNGEKHTKDIVTPGMEWVLAGEGVATLKLDGACCAIIDGELHKRYDCKKGRKAPEGFIPCDEPDKITGHWPGWVKCSRTDPADKWFWKAYDHTAEEHPEICQDALPDGTYEAIGIHFQGNPYGLDYDVLVPHGKIELEVERSFEGIRKYLAENCVEGIVFWKDGQPGCKIKRSDFGFAWNRKEKRK